MVQTSTVRGIGVEPTVPFLGLGFPTPAIVADVQKTIFRKEEKGASLLRGYATKERILSCRSDKGGDCHLQHLQFKGFLDRPVTGPEELNLP